MKKIISLLLGVVAGTVLAQDTGTEIQRKAFCMDKKDLETLVDRFQEIPVARGINVFPAPSSLVIFINPDKKSFTVVERVSTDSYCVLAVGGDFEAVPESIQRHNQQRQEKSRP